MNQFTLYHNPRCSKSRQTLELLTQNNVDVTIVEYLKTPPNAQVLEEILSLLDLHPRQLMRTSEEAYSQLGLDNDALSNEHLIQAMVENPKLIERPILLVEDNATGSKKAAIGRPPETVLTIL